MPNNPLAPRPEDDSATQKLLRAFVRDGRISTIPARRSRRRLLLDRVVRFFEPGRRYQETEVNGILRQVYDDHVTLRRLLVDAGFLERDHGVYWRIGGQVDPFDHGLDDAYRQGTADTA